MAARRVSVTVAAARDLVSADKNGLSDPYCRVSLSGKHAKATQVQKKTLQPSWNETFEFSNVGDGAIVKFEVLDEDVNLFGKKLGKKLDDPLGTCEFRLDLAEIGEAGGVVDKWLKLEHVATGELHVQISVEESERKVQQQQAAVAAAATATGDAQYEFADSTAAPASSSTSSSASVDVPFVVGSSSFLPTIPAGETDIYMKVAEGVPLLKSQFSSLPSDDSKTKNDDDRFFRERVFVAGEDINVTLYFQVQEPQITVRSVLVRFLGQFSVGTGIKAQKVGKKICESFGALFQEKKILVRGKHGFNFSLKLPAACPSSVILQGGVHARYTLSVDVDVVNRADEHVTKEIAVVNKAHTPLGASVPRAREQTTRKSCRTLKGRRADTGDITLAVSLASDTLQPLHDIEVDATITSSLTTTTLKTLIVDLEATHKVPGTTATKANVFVHRLQLVPKLRGSGTHKQKFIFELPARIGHSFVFRDFSTSYELSFSLDVPGSDLKLRFPITVILPDPTVPDALFSLAPLEEISRLPRRFEHFTSRDVRTWLTYVASKENPLVLQALAGFASHDPNGSEVTTLFHELSDSNAAIAALCTSDVDASVVTAVHQCLAQRVMPWEDLRRFLTHSGLAHVLRKFVEHDVSYGDLGKLTHKDMVDRMGLKVGESLRIQSFAAGTSLNN